MRIKKLFATTSNGICIVDIQVALKVGIFCNDITTVSRHLDNVYISDKKMIPNVSQVVLTLNYNLHK